MIPIQDNDADQPYTCDTPVVLFIFNRPEKLKALLSALSKVRPKSLLVVSDGPRENNASDRAAIAACRALLDKISWSCEVQTLYSDINLGLKRRFSSGLEWVFEKEESAIVLEDDCIPTVDFFRFCEWALDEYRDEDDVVLVSGSNLDIETRDARVRNGYSTLINIWGWAGWKKTWNCFDPYLSLSELHRTREILAVDYTTRWWERLFWINVFKHAIYARHGWDFYLQHGLFVRRKLSVFPMRNLVLNVGFGEEATHTTGEPPKYLTLSHPDSQPINLLSAPIDRNIRPDRARDRRVSRLIWSCTLLTALRLQLTNTVRYFFI
jgi:hypothetical protein